MVALIVAGEAIFGLPFMIARVFRPTLLDVFGLTNFELGAAFSLYGIVAMIAYFPGGPLADRFPARKLMSLALLTTAAGGAYYATVPSVGGLKLLFGLWGVTSILLFWAALIRATRVWGGHDKQGAAFGILDGGRGLFGAVLASSSLFVFSRVLPAEVATATLEQKTEALVQVIWLVTAATVVAAFLVWWLVPEDESDTKSGPAAKASHIREVLRNPRVWLQGIIVICAYTGYKAQDDWGLYATDVFGYNDAESAELGTVAFWVRPFAALLAGLVGDRFGGARTIAVCFAVMIAGHLALGFGFVPPTMPWLLVLSIIVISVAVFGLRGLYFAIFEAARVPAAVTGTAVGVVSIIGYTPDVFMGPLMGYLTDNYSGATGHHYLFFCLAGFAAIGLAATLVFRRVSLRVR